jgi:hypothetical protein
VLCVSKRGQPSLDAVLKGTVYDQHGGPFGPALGVVDRGSTF